MVSNKTFSSPRQKVGLSCADSESVTQQHFKEECDINTIVKRYSQTGLITHVNKSQPNYGYATSQSFTEAMHMVATATEEFEKLPSEIRAHFDNDTAKYLDAIQDESRVDELAEIGLIEKPTPDPIEEPKIEPPAPEEPSTSTPEGSSLEKTP